MFKGLLGLLSSFNSEVTKRLRVAHESCLKLFDLILKTCDERKDDPWSLIIESENS
jgi:hypothetical protein